MSETAAGWYPDPAGGPAQRWWDGTQWTASTMPATGAPVYAQLPQQGQDQFGASTAGGLPSWGQTGYAQQPYGQAPDGQSSYGQAPSGQSSYGQAPYGQAPYGQGAAGYQNGPVKPGSFYQRNRYSVIAIGVSLLYAIIALASHFVLIGIIPILMTVRAFQAKEKAAPAAAVAAGIALVLTIAAFT